MAEPARQLRDCPRVIGTEDGRLRTCGHLLPCPFHGAPAQITIVDGTITDPAGEQ